MDKISGILASPTRPTWTTNEALRPKRLSDPMPDDRERQALIRPLSRPLTIEGREIDGRPEVFRSSMLDIKA